MYPLALMLASSYDRAKIDRCCEFQGRPRAQAPTILGATEVFAARTLLSTM
jgi:hypothetical protein